MMPITSALTRIGRSIALLALLIAALFFLFFALSPSIELLPDGMDLIVGALLGVLVLTWIGTGLLNRKAR